MDTALVSIGFEMDQDKGAHTVWFDDIRAVINDRAKWSPIPHDLWSIDKSARDLILTVSGVRRAGYNLLKLTGGDNPVLLNADATVAEVDEQYIIQRATALALEAKAGGSSDDQRANLVRAERRHKRADEAEGGFPALQGVRKVE